MTRLQAVPEASGIALSQRTPGVAWSHNDSGEPVLFALGGDGTVKGRLRLTGAQAIDWEDVAVGPCPQGRCLYVAGIGDNAASRRSITIFRTPEPAAGEVTAKAEVLNAKYPDGSHDAEAFFVVPGGGMFIVTKGETGPVALYRFPAAFQDGANVTLERVAVLSGQGAAAKSNDDKGKKDAKAGKDDKNKKNKGKADKDADAKSANVVGVAKGERITGADASADGRWIVLRTNSSIRFYAANEFVAGTIREVSRYDLGALAEPQGEGVALASNGDVWLTGEGGGKGQAGTFARLSCTLR